MIPRNSYRPDDVKKAVALCGDNYQCQFDYALTLNRDLAHFTKNYYDTYTQIRSTNSKRSTLKTGKRRCNTMIRIFQTIQYLSLHQFLREQAIFYFSVTTCGILETPRFGRKSNFFFVPGTKVTFECNQDFVLIGDQRRICTPEGQWDAPEFGYTECLRKYLSDQSLYVPRCACFYA